MSRRKLKASKSRTKSGTQYSERLKQVERQLLAKQAELQQAEVELLEANELLQVLII
jgi:DNA-binding protein YbaB